MATQNQIHNINISRVLRFIWLNRGCSRAEMCRDLGLNKSTVTKNVQILLDEGIVEEISEGEVSALGGRRPVALGVRQDFCYILGIEIQTESYSAVISNARGQIVYTRSNQLKNMNLPLIEQFRNIVDELQGVMKEFHVMGIALGLSGVINTKEGIISRSMPFGIKQPLPFRSMASEISGLPVLIENDANCCCWGDLAGQKSSREQNSLFLLSEFRDQDLNSPGQRSLALGLGFVINGLVHHGSGYSAGEFTSVLKTRTGQGQFSQEAEVIAEFWDDPEQKSGRTDLLKEISRNVAFLVNSLNITRIVIGGILEVFQAEVRNEFEESIQSSWPYHNQVKCQIEFSDLGEYGVAFGACGYYLEQLFGLADVEEQEQRGWAFLKEQAARHSL